MYCVFKKTVLLSLTILLHFLGNAQTGSIELSSGGFSFVPAFTSKEPNVIINASTNPQKRLSGHLLYMMRVKSATPTGVVIMTRYKLLDKKVKLSVGLHIPAMQISSKYEVTSLFGQELNLSIPVSKSVTLGTFLLNGKGRNNDFKAFFTSAFANYHHEKWNLLSQAYYLDKGHLVGATETLSYQINKRFQLKGLVNYTITDKNFISTIGVNYTL